jgi:hypothetical protein
MGRELTLIKINQFFFMYQLANLLKKVNLLRYGT